MKSERDGVVLVGCRVMNGDVAPHFFSGLDEIMIEGCVVRHIIDPEAMSILEQAMEERKLMIPMGPVDQIVALRAIEIALERGRVTPPAS